MKITSAVLCLLLATVPSAAFSIVIRHDRDDAKYQALAQGHDEVCNLGGAMGTLIDKRWVLTAAHVGIEMSPFTTWVKIKGKIYWADRVIIHPDYMGDQSRPNLRDVALLHLTEDVVGVTPAKLYRKKDEVGKQVLFVGNGDTGTGKTGPTGNDGKMRGAHNMLTEANEKFVAFEFDEGDKGVDLEGISGPGDSGGPALVKEGNDWYVLGVSSANRGNGKGLCEYGTTEFYARVSTSVDWIDEQMRTMPPSSVKWDIQNPFVAWAKDRTSEIASALMASFNTGDVSKYEEFNQKYRLPSSLKARTPEARAKVFNDFYDRFGKLKILAVAHKPDGGLAILADSEKLKRKITVMVFVQMDEGKLMFLGWNLIGMPS